jgi:hypothetical protein
MCCIEILRKTTQHAIGFKSLIGKKFKRDLKCPSCMPGKSELEKYPGLMEPAQHPLARVQMDMYPSSVTSSEGYKY